jgi:hypothetical protein
MEGKHLVVVGAPISLQASLSGPEAARRLAQAWCDSTDALAEELDWMAGRYVVFGQSGEDGFLQTDASGLLSAFYSADDDVIASHQNLVSDYMRNPELSVFGSVEWLRSTRAFTYPGLNTRWRGVRLLTANTELSLPTYNIRRVGPRQIEPNSARQAAEKVLELLRVQHPFLYREGLGPMVSLTAGLDSRITLAGLRGIAAESAFFTYQVGYGNNTATSKRDADIARQLAARFDLDHQTFVIREPLPSSQLKGLIARNSPLTHNRALARLYRRVLPKDRLHVRSNVYEIGRAYYQQVSRPKADARLFTYLLTHGRSESADVTAAFDEMIEATGLLSVDGYDPLDLFYWEILLESDIAHDTHVLVNSRAILQILLSVPIADRISARAYEHMIAIAWPELYDVPVNGQQRVLPALT